MQAAILENGRIRVGDLPDPTPRKGQAIVRTHGPLSTLGATNGHRRHPGVKPMRPATDVAFPHPSAR
jgi:hypothetical protein